MDLPEIYIFSNFQSLDVLNELVKNDANIDIGKDINEPHTAISRSKNIKIIFDRNTRELAYSLSTRMVEAGFARFKTDQLTFTQKITEKDGTSTSHIIYPTKDRIILELI